MASYKYQDKIIGKLVHKSNLIKKMCGNLGRSKFTQIELVLYQHLRVNDKQKLPVDWVVIL